jgi:hypothetical protein
MLTPPGAPKRFARARQRLLFHFKAMLWPVAMLGIVAFIWAGYYERWTAESWQVPSDYSGDSLELLARIRIAMDGDTQPWGGEAIIDRLGAPLGANWAAYPASDKWLLQIFGWLARWLGLMETANLALLLAHLSAAGSFYFCARQLRYRRPWAAAGAVLYANMYMMFARGLPHLLLVFSWTVPCVLLVSWWLAGRVNVSGRRRVILFTAAVLGASNPYNLFMGLQLWGWAMIAQWLGARRASNLKAGVWALIVACVAFGFSNAAYFGFSWSDETRPALTRNYGGTERYALKPIELLVPPPDHHWDVCAALGRRYLRWSEWRGESFSPYLGWFGVVGLGGLLAVAAARMLRGKRPPGSALQAAWIFVYANVGGLTNVIALFFGLQVFRATNRFSVFLSALGLFFLVGCLHRLSIRRGLTTPLCATVALVMIVVGWYDQVPRRARDDRVAQVARDWRSDQDFGGRLEARLGAGAAVFQLPVMLFPEETPPGEIRPYGHFRPYLATETLRFSYGSLKYRPRQEWQFDAEKMPPEKLAQALERWGFSALYINRKGYADRGESLLKGFADLGYTERIESERGNQIAIMLRPSDRPGQPLAHQPTWGSGWYFPDKTTPAGPRWAHGPATLLYYNPLDRPLLARARVTVSGQGPRQLTIRLEGETVFDGRIDEAPQAITLGELWLKPGRNTFRFSTDRPAERIHHERYGVRAFALHDIVWSHETDTAVAP